MGLILSGMGILMTFIGIALFFNSTILKFGNILFISGLPLVIGTGRFITYVTNPSRLRATSTFLLGVFLVVLAGWPVIGMMVEIFGFLNLFGNLFPLLRGIFQRLPVAGDMFSPRRRKGTPY